MIGDGVSPNPTENGLDPLSWTYFDDLEKKLREWQDICKSIQIIKEIDERKEKIQKVSIQVLDILEQEKNVDRKQFAIMNNFRYVRAVFLNSLIGIFYGSRGMNIKHDKYYSTKKINLMNEMLKLIVANINLERKRYDENLTDISTLAI